MESCAPSLSSCSLGGPLNQRGAHHRGSPSIECHVHGGQPLAWHGQSLPSCPARRGWWFRPSSLRLAGDLRRRRLVVWMGERLDTGRSAAAAGVRPAGLGDLICELSLPGAGKRGPRIVSCGVGIEECGEFDWNCVADDLHGDLDVVADRNAGLATEPQRDLDEEALVPRVDATPLEANTVDGAVDGHPAAEVHDGGNVRGHDQVWRGAVGGECRLESRCGVHDSCAPWCPRLRWRRRNAHRNEPKDPCLHQHSAAQPHRNAPASSRARPTGATVRKPTRAKVEPRAGGPVARNTT